MTCTSFFGEVSGVFVFGGGGFSDTAVFVGLGILSNLDGFASAEIFLVDVGGLSGFVDKGDPSDKVTFFLTGLLGAVGRAEGSSGLISVKAVLDGEAGLFGEGGLFAEGGPFGEAGLFGVAVGVSLD